MPVHGPQVPQSETKPFYEGDLSLYRGFHHPKGSNFSRGLEYASRHNQKYWNHSPYFGLGPSAHSFVRDQRWWNHHSLDSYPHAINRGDIPVEGKETLTTEHLQLEAFYFGFRTKKGINLNEFKSQYALI